MLRARNSGAVAGCLSRGVQPDCGALSESARRLPRKLHGSSTCAGQLVVIVVPTLRARLVVVVSRCAIGTDRLRQTIGPVMAHARDAARWNGQAQHLALAAATGLLEPAIVIANRLDGAKRLLNDGVGQSRKDWRRTSSDVPSQARAPRLVLCFTQAARWLLATATAAMQIVGVLLPTASVHVAARCAARPVHQRRARPAVSPRWKSRHRHPWSPTRTR